MSWPEAVCVLGIFVFAGWVLYVMAREENDAALRGEVAALAELVAAMQPVIDAAFAWAARPDADVESTDRLLDALYEYEQEAAAHGDG